MLTAAAYFQFIHHLFSYPARIGSYIRVCHRLVWLEISNLRLAEKEFRLSYEPVEISKMRREIMNNKIYSYGMYLFRIIALVVMSIITNRFDKRQSALAELFVKNQSSVFALAKLG